jgi:hypothetical protein
VSIRLTRLRPLTCSLVLLNALLAILLVYTAWSGTQVSALLATPPKPFATPSLDITPQPGLSARSTLQDRPLFYASRHSYTPPPPSALPVAPPKPDYRLVGTFVIPSKPTVALMSSPAGASRKVKAGDDLDGWSVVAVENGRVVLQFQGQTTEITSSGKTGSTGLQRMPIPLAPQAAQNSTSGVRVLGNEMPRVSLSQSVPDVPSSSPRLYRPPPK